MVSPSACARASVAMVQIRIVRVRMHDRPVTVRVGVRLAYRVAGLVLMLVVRVMDMAVLVREGGVSVLVLVALRKMEINAGRDQHPGDAQPRGDGLAEEGDGEPRADERRGRKIGPGPRGAEMPQRQHEQHEAQPIAEKPDHRGAADRGYG